MDKRLAELTHALNKTIWQLKPQHNALSLLLLVGKPGQGKTTLLRQSTLNSLELSHESAADIYYNAQGIVLDFNHGWFESHNLLLQHVLKEINHCHHALKINGILFGIDCNELYGDDPTVITQTLQTHTQLLQRFGQALHYRVDTSIILTKIDRIAGFSDFFHQDHVHDPIKPLGFSIEWHQQKTAVMNNYRKRFDSFIQSLDHEIIKKIHPVRSNIKRKLIREFPLQLTPLRLPLQTLLQATPTHPCRIQAIYLTSALQAGNSVDYLNEKIQHDYSLTVRHQFPQATNQRAYFVEGAIHNTQSRTQQYSRGPRMTTPTWQTRALLGVVTFACVMMGYHYTHTKHTLDDVSKELLAYDLNRAHTNQSATALFHLTQASLALKRYDSSFTAPGAIDVLKTALHTEANHQLNQTFIPTILQALEQTLVSRDVTPNTLYHTLKVYLMLENSKYFDEKTLIHWFKTYWQQHENHDDLASRLSLLQQMFKEPRPPIALNQSLVNDVRKYLNALPRDYLYYSMAKKQFKVTSDPLQFEGFILKESSLPYAFTREGFNETLQKIPPIAHQFEQESWVLARRDLKQLSSNITDAYGYAYALWWKNFIQQSSLKRTQTYAEAQTLFQQLEQKQTFKQMLQLIQKHTSADLSQKASLFNAMIASQFTPINLISESSLDALSHSLHELQPFLMTISMVDDNGQTAFLLSKSLFVGEGLSSPLASLYDKAHQFAAPVSTWLKQLADDTWFLLLNDAQRHINAQWQAQVYTTYQQTIAKHYPFDPLATDEISIANFEQFFAPTGILAHFIERYLTPFMDTSEAAWKLKTTAHYVLPISKPMLNELMRANIISTMFFPQKNPHTQVDFSLQMINLDPIIAHLTLSIGKTTLNDSQTSHQLTQFSWPAANAKLSLVGIDGKHYDLAEQGPWALFKLLQKVNVMVDEQDNSMQIIFEINGNAGRYVLKTKSKINPFIPGILNGFHLQKSIISGV